MIVVIGFVNPVIIGLLSPSVIPCIIFIKAVVIIFCAAVYRVLLLFNVYLGFGNPAASLSPYAIFVRFVELATVIRVSSY